MSTVTYSYIFSNLKSTKWCIFTYIRFLRSLVVLSRSFVVPEKRRFESASTRADIHTHARKYALGRGFVNWPVKCASLCNTLEAGVKIGWVVVVERESKREIEKKRKKKRKKARERSFSRGSPMTKRFVAFLSTTFPRSSPRFSSDVNFRRDRRRVIPFSLDITVTYTVRILLSLSARTVWKGNVSLLRKLLTKRSNHRRPIDP